MHEFSNHAVLSMSDSTVAVSSKYTQDLSVQIVFFTFSCKMVSLFLSDEVILSESNVMGVLYLAKNTEYMVSSLADKCTKYLQDNLARPHQMFSASCPLLRNMKIKTWWKNAGK